MSKNDNVDCKDIGEGWTICKQSESKEVGKQPKEEDLGLVGDLSKAVFIVTRPMLTQDEASFIETNFSSVLIGYIISGFSIAFGFYIYFLIGSMSLTILPDPLWNAIVMMLILIIVISILSFVQYRITKAIASTKILERLALDNGDNMKEYMI